MKRKSTVAGQSVRKPLRKINVHEAKTQFSRLLALVEKGESIVIARAGVPVAELRPFVEQPRERRLGIDRRRVWVSDDFNDPLPDDLLAGFR